MKKLLPLVALAALGACNMYDNDHYNNRTGQRTDVAPVVVERPVTGTAVIETPSGYVTTPATGYVAERGYVKVPGYQHTHAEDALSDRTMGNSRGVHNEPMTAKDADNDGNYDFQPYYSTSPYVPYYAPRANNYYYAY